MAMTERQELEMLRAKKAAITNPMKQTGLSERQELDMLRAKKAQAPQPQGSALNPLAQGLSFGWGDEAAAGALVSYGVMSGEIPANQAETAFNSIVQGINSEREAYANQNPVKSTAIEAGSAMVMGLPKILESLAQKGLVSAGMVAGAEGALYGAGTGGKGYEKGEEIALGVEAPMDISGRVVEGAKTATIAAPLGVVGARVAQGVTNKLSGIAERNKLISEGVPAPETAGYALKDASQKQPLPAPEAGVDIVEETIQSIPQAPQGVVENTKYLLQSTPLAGNIQEIPSAKRALYQEVPPTIITGIREANTPTRNAMKNVAEIHWAKVNNKTSQDPFLVIGNEFGKRLTKIQSEQSKAIAQQSKAVDKQLRSIRGEELDSVVNEVGESFTRNLEKNLITLDDAGNLDFSSVKQTSPLGKAANRNVLNRVWTDFRNARTAGDLHDLRRNIDKLTKYEKGGIRGGVDDDTAAILKDIRSQIRTSLHNVSPEYAEANGIISQNLEAYDVLAKAMPRLKNYDLEDPRDYETAMKYIGQQLRSMDANTTNSAELSQAVDMFDDLARGYGGNYPVDLKQTSRFLSEIKLRLGEGKPAALQAKMEAASRRGGQDITPKGMLWQKTKQVFNPIKGISDDEAYKAIIDNINEMNKRELK
jgi:hypothetical protein